jgi:hypothetical protein
VASCNFSRTHQGARKSISNFCVSHSGCSGLNEQNNSFLLSRGQMISAEDCEFIQRFEMKRSSEDKQEMLQTEGSQVILTFIL